jgi:hypothetical protein
VAFADPRAPKATGPNGASDGRPSDAPNESATPVVLAGDGEVSSKPQLRRRDVKLVFVTKETLGEWFEKAKPFIQQIAEGSGGRHTVETLRKELEAGAYWMAVAAEESVRACLIAYAHTWGTGLKEIVIIGLTGSGMKDWLHLESGLREKAKAQGFHVLKAFARPGWSRVMKNYRLTHAVMEVTL